MRVSVLKIGKRYYTGMVESKQCIYAFKGPVSAHTCKMFLEQHRIMHGVYPRVVPGKDRVVLPELAVPSVHEEQLDRLQGLCRLGGLGLFGIHEFEYTIQRNATHIRMKGENLEDTLGLEVDPVEVLEVLYKINES